MQDFQEKNMADSSQLIISLILLFDKDEARKSFQAAPEKYRKESSYLDVDGINSAAPTAPSNNNKPKVPSE